MEGDDVVALCDALGADGVTFWLMGGWGVDALLGRQTRRHHDLDLVVEVRSFERFQRRLDSLGFERAYTWDGENRWVHDDAWTGQVEQPTAVVYQHADGREVDVHVLRLATDGAVTVLWNTPYQFTAEGLRGEGVVEGQRVPCLSREMQRKAHSGYELPSQHIEDLRLLTALPHEGDGHDRPTL